MQQNNDNKVLKEKEESKININVNKTLTNKKTKPKNQKEYEKLKQRYFDYYDDIKSHTHDVYDW